MIAPEQTRTLSWGAFTSGSGLSRWTVGLMVIIGIAMWGLAAHRAGTASFTHDESFSYLHYPQQRLADILLHKEAHANNHLLNTLGMKYAEKLFGTSELALRLPNLLALVIYLTYGALFMRRCAPPLAVGGLLLLCTNAYLMEFFTLARGYGLSFGFLLMAQYHLACAASTHRARHLVLFHVASVLASLSNFTLLSAQVAGLMAFAFVVFMHQRTAVGKLPQLGRLHGVNIVMLVLSVVVLYAPVRHFMQEHSFDFHDERGFYGTTVHTWVRSMLPGVVITPLLLITMQVFITLVALLPLMIIFIRYRQRKNGFFVQYTGLIVITITLLVTCAAAELQYALLNANHLSVRFALFLVPLILLLFTFLLHQLHEAGARKMAWAIMGSALLWSVPAFLRSFGPYKSAEWTYDVRTKDAMAAMVADHGANDGSAEPVRIGNTWVLEPAMNYYRHVWKLDWLEPVDRNGLSADDQYRLVIPENEQAGYDDGFAMVASFSESGVVLLRRVGMLDEPLGE